MQSSGRLPGRQHNFLVPRGHFLIGPLCARLENMQACSLRTASHRTGPEGTSPTHSRPSESTDGNRVIAQLTAVTRRVGRDRSYRHRLHARLDEARCALVARAYSKLSIVRQQLTTMGVCL